MSNRLANYVIAGALVSALALASPALAFRGGGGMHGMGGGMGMHGMHGGGMAGHAMAFAPRGAASFGAAPISRPGWGSGWSRSAFPHHARFFHNRFHHRFNRFAFFGAPFLYAGYDYCWRQVWTRYGLQWVSVCGYGY